MSDTLFNKNILLISGWTINSNIWDEVPYLRECQRVDIPGIGLEKSIFDDRLSAYAQAITHLKKYIRENFNTPPVIIGWSLGGQLAALLAEAAHSLILVNTTPYYTLDHEATTQFQQMAEQNLGKALRYFYSIAGQDKERIQDYSEVSGPISLAYLNELINADLRQKKITKKTLVIHTVADKIIPVRHAKLWKESITDLDTAILESDAHFPFLLPQTKSLLADFLASSV